MDQRTTRRVSFCDTGMFTMLTCAHVECKTSGYDLVDGHVEECHECEDDVDQGFDPDHGEVGVRETLSASPDGHGLADHLGECEDEDAEEHAKEQRGRASASRWGVVCRIVGRGHVDSVVSAPGGGRPPATVETAISGRGEGPGSAKC
jgi:hypothetical protein